jgi:aerobic carbon-monoxide dehydrogenase medium subunit
MYPANFGYLRAGSIAEAGELLRQHPGAKILAGGHSLIPMLKLRLTAPPMLVDIGRIAEMKGITIAGASLRIGALTTHAELARSPLVREHVPALAEAAAHVGDPAVRNRGTIGGNVAHADPASDLPTVLTALDARFELVGAAGVTTCNPATFFQGMMTTAVGEHDVLTAIEIPMMTAAQGMSYVKFDHPASRYAVIGVAAVLTTVGGRCTAAAVAVGGLVPKPVRASSVEQALVGQALSPDAIASASALLSNDLGRDILGDIYASAEYRKAVAPVYVKRALSAAAARVR